MRFLLCTAMLALSIPGIVLCQDTNFSSGPQYLLSSNSAGNITAYLMRPIATPSLSLSGPPLDTGASNATQGLIAGAESRNAAVPPSDTLPAVNLFPIYYGGHRFSVIEIRTSQATVNTLPASIVDAGIGQPSNISTVRTGKYETTPPEGVATRKLPAQNRPRVYTNEDIDRLREGS